MKIKTLKVVSLIGLILLSVGILIESIKNGRLSSQESNTITNVLVGGNENATINKLDNFDVEFDRFPFVVGEETKYSINTNGATDDRFMIYSYEYDSTIDENVVEINLSKHTIKPLKESNNFTLVLQSFNDKENFQLIPVSSTISSNHNSTLLYSSSSNLELDADETQVFQYGKVTPLSFSVYDKTKNFKIDLSTTKALTDTLVFSSYDKSIVDIDSYGNLLGYKKGMTTIIVSLKNNPLVKKEISVVITSIPVSTYRNISFLVRKIIGHFSFFLATGVFSYLTMYLYLSFKSKKKALYAALIALSYGILLATISELIQLIPGGRSGNIEDILLDTLGYLLGECITILIVYLVVKKKRKEIK